MLYNVLIVYLDPFIQQWTSQNYLPSPHPLHYLSAFALVLPYAFWGARRLVRVDFLRAWLPLGWVLSLPLLAYAPVGLQRRLPEGVWVALVVLAMAAFDTPRLDRRRFLYPLILAFPSAVFIYAGGLMVAGKPAQPVFRPGAEVTVFEYLNDHESKDRVVLCSYETGNALPAWAPVRVVIGHGPESIYLDQLGPRVQAFYSSSDTDFERRALLSEFLVDYVFWGPAERALGGWDPNRAAYLQLVFQVDDYLLFQVKELSP